MSSSRDSAFSEFFPASGARVERERGPKIGQGTFTFRPAAEKKLVLALLMLSSSRPIFVAFLNADTDKKKR